ncbi:hypothetical protein NQ176_g6093 [Zarea fungicola]|uniref:Uncharacterized protein n=1 Tax=Zarea fungicola TaxID=93591 RepID=A0ACC1N5K6_9HYPO|nr:hypothetical protein NQ176_g6093 [Lecanicillium fungicola]
MSSHNSNQPLLQGDRSSKVPSQSDTITGPASSPHQTVYILSGLKTVFGLGCLFVPKLTSAVLLLDPIQPQAGVVTRLYGGACVALGYLLFVLAQSRAKKEISNTVLKKAVAINIAADAVDVVSCTVGYFSGVFGLPTFSLVGGGCLALEVLGTIAYYCI